MAKRVKKPSVPNRKYISRMERDKRLRGYIYIGAGLVFGLIVILMAWGLYDEYFVKPRRPVAVVSGDTILLNEYQSLVRYLRYDYRMQMANLEAQRQQLAASEDQQFLVQLIDQQIQQAQSELAMLPTSALEQLIEDRILRQEAAARGITVTSEEVQLELERQFGYERPDAITENGENLDEQGEEDVLLPTPVPMTEEEFLERKDTVFRSIEQATRFSEDDFRWLLESALYRQKVEAALTANVPTSVEQVHARHILVETEVEAEQVLSRLREGEAFEALAAELSIDTVSGEQGGDLGWFPRDWMVEPFEQAAFGLAAGEISSPVESQFGYHIIEVLERDDSRPLDETQVQHLYRQVLDEWYFERTNAEDIERYWNPSMVP